MHRQVMVHRQREELYFDICCYLKMQDGPVSYRYMNIFAHPF
jgi:hypothetical protein